MCVLRESVSFVYEREPIWASIQILWSKSEMNEAYVI